MASSRIAGSVVCGLSVAVSCTSIIVYALEELHKWGELEASIKSMTMRGMIFENLLRDLDIRIGQRTFASL